MATSHSTPFRFTQSLLTHNFTNISYDHILIYIYKHFLQLFTFITLQKTEKKNPTKKPKQIVILVVMASLTAVSMATPITTTTKTSFFNPLPQRSVVLMGQNKPTRGMGLKVQASLKEKAVTGLTAAALTASMITPDVAQAAELSPSLKNFLLSIVAGGVVLTAILGAVIAVANFDPVKRT